MEPILNIVVCGNYEDEVREVVRLEGWEDVTVSTYTRMCVHPKMSGPSRETNLSVSKYADQDHTIVLNCQHMQPSLVYSNFEQVTECFDLLINKSLVEESLKQKCFVITPHWLKDWRMHIAELKCDQSQARQLFQPFSSGLLLLDTGLNADNPALLQEMALYLDLSHRTQRVGLDFITLYLKQIVYAWRQKRSLSQIEQLNKAANRTIADYSMSIDLLTNLTRIHSEDDIYDEIADLFSMLFSNGDVVYYPLTKNRLIVTTKHHLFAERKTSLESWLKNSKEPFRYSGTGRGFDLRIGYLSQTMGVLVVENLSMPQYMDQYLNLAIMIAGLCGLSIFNTRNYQKLQTAKKSANRQRKIAESLRVSMIEIAKGLGQDGLLKLILTSLYEVTPYDDALVFLRDGESLIFSYGLKKIKGGVLTPYVPEDKYLKIPIDWPLTKTLTQDDVQRYPVLRSYVNPEKSRSWLGLHLIHQNSIVGLLSISSKLANQYPTETIRLVEAFGGEVSIILENDRLFQENRRAAILDGLTGIFNRRHFFELGVIEFERAKRYHHPLSTLMIDLDNFKQVNDQFGHLAGDQVLQWFAKLCTHNKRTSDILCRYGGEEFAMLLPETNIANAINLAERLRQMVASQVANTSKGDIPITCSIGISVMNEECVNLEQLLDHSDSALYAAKRAGRNRVMSLE